MTTKQYTHNLMLTVDQLGNTVFRGNPDSTISARTGFNSAMTNSRFWLLQERFINYAFKPLDGENHCRQAWQADKDEYFNDAGTMTRVLMAATVMLSCFVIGTLLRGFKLIKSFL
ncbi:MAG: hypothetical protein ACPGGD_09990 [Thalassolituus sp.]